MMSAGRNIVKAAAVPVRGGLVVLVKYILQ